MSEVVSQENRRRTEGKRQDQRRDASTRPIRSEEPDTQYDTEDDCCADEESVKCDHTMRLTLMSAKRSGR